MNRLSPDSTIDPYVDELPNNANVDYMQIVIRNFPSIERVNKEVIAFSVRVKFPIQAAQGCRFLHVNFVVNVNKRRMTAESTQ